jgi:hypothetical protein
MDVWVLDNETMLVNIAVVGRIWQHDCLAREQWGLEYGAFRHPCIRELGFRILLMFRPLELQSVMRLALKFTSKKRRLCKRRLWTWKTSMERLRITSKKRRLNKWHTPKAPES